MREVLHITSYAPDLMKSWCMLISHESCGLTVCFNNHILPAQGWPGAFVRCDGKRGTDDQISPSWQNTVVRPILQLLFALNYAKGRLCWLYYKLHFYIHYVQLLNPWFEITSLYIQRVRGVSSFLLAKFQSRSIPFCRLWTATTTTTTASSKPSITVCLLSFHGLSYLFTSLVAMCSFVYLAMCSFV